MERWRLPLAGVALAAIIGVGTWLPERLAHWADTVQNPLALVPLALYLICIPVLLILVPGYLGAKGVPFVQVIAMWYLTTVALAVVMTVAVRLNPLAALVGSATLGVVALGDEGLTFTLSHFARNAPVWLILIAGFGLGRWLRKHRLSAAQHAHPPDSREV